MQKQSVDEYEDYDDFEEWEGDADLINEEDWKGLLKLREQRAMSKPDDLYAQERYGEALILNQQYQQALDYMTPYYQVYHELEFGIGRIMDALIGLGKTEKDFNWIKEPRVLRLDQTTIKLCKNFLKGKKNFIQFIDLHFYLMDNADYLTFKDQDLANFLRKNVNDFICIGESTYYYDLSIKLKKS